MRRLIVAAFLIMAAWTTSANAQIWPEWGFLTKDVDAKVAAVGGKFSLRDWKQIPRGATCRVASGALIYKVEEEGSDVMVRYFTAMQTETGGCPAMTPFVISRADWNAAKKSYEETLKKWDPRK